MVQPLLAVFAALIPALAAADARAQSALEALRAYGIAEIEAPDPRNPNDWLEKYRADWPIHVSVENDELVLRRWTHHHARQVRHRAAGIEYISRNRGEFGGGLDAVFAGGRQIRLLNDNVVALLARGSSLLVVSGLAHGPAEGAIHRIDDAFTKPRARRLTLLPDAPAVVLEGPDGVYLVGYSSLMSFRERRQERLVVHAWGPYWSGRLPVSAAFYRGALIIGAYNCIVLVELDNNERAHARYFQQTAVDRLWPDEVPTKAARKAIEEQRRAAAEAAKKQRQLELDAALRGALREEEDTAKPKLGNEPPEFLGKYRAPSAGDRMFEQAKELERRGRGAEAVELYARAAQSGSTAAARRLADIFFRGIPGVPRDVAASINWDDVARGRTPRVWLHDSQPSHPLFERAQALEREGRGAEAVRLYVRAARAGSGKAALRLGEIYDKGTLGVARDFAESLKWYNAARLLGEDVPPRDSANR